MDWGGSVDHDVQIGAPPNIDTLAQQPPGIADGSNLARSLVTLLRASFIDALHAHLSLDNRAQLHFLQNPDLLRDLHWYQAGMNQISLLSKVQRSALVSLALDCMPSLVISDSFPLPSHTPLNPLLSFTLLESSLGLQSLGNRFVSDFTHLFVVDTLTFALKTYLGGFSRDVESELVSWAMAHLIRYAHLSETEMTPVANEILNGWVTVLHLLTPWASEAVSAALSTLTTRFSDRASLNALPVLLKGFSSLRLEPLTQELYDSLYDLVQKLFNFAAHSISISSSFSALQLAWTEVISNILIQRHVTFLITSVSSTSYGNIASQLTLSDSNNSARMAFFDAIVSSFKAQRKLQTLRNDIRDYHPAFHTTKSLISLSNFDLEQQLLHLGACTAGPCFHRIPVDHGMDHDSSTSSLVIKGSPIGYAQFSFNPVGISPTWLSHVSMVADQAVGDIVSAFFKKPSAMSPLLVTSIYHAPKLLEHLASSSDKFTPKSTQVALNALYYVVCNYLDLMLSRMKCAASSSAKSFPVAQPQQADPYVGFDVHHALAELLFKFDQVVFNFYLRAKSKIAKSAQDNFAPSPPASSSSPSLLGSPERPRRNLSSTPQPIGTLQSAVKRQPSNAPQLPSDSITSPGPNITSSSSPAVTRPISPPKPVKRELFSLDLAPVGESPPRRSSNASGLPRSNAISASPPVAALSPIEELRNSTPTRRARRPSELPDPLLRNSTPVSPAPNTSASVPNNTTSLNTTTTNGTTSHTPATTDPIPLDSLSAQPQSDKAPKAPKLRLVLDMVNLIIKILKATSQVACFSRPYKCWNVEETRDDFHSTLISSCRQHHPIRLATLSSIFSAISDPSNHQFLLPKSSNKLSNASNDLKSRQLGQSLPAGYLFQWFSDVAQCAQEMTLDISTLGKMELVAALSLSSPYYELRSAGLSLVHHMRLSSSGKVTLNAVLQSSTPKLIQSALLRISRQDPHLYSQLWHLQTAELWDRMQRENDLWWYFAAELFRAYSVEDHLLNDATTNSNSNFDALSLVMTLFESSEATHSPLIPSYLLLLFSLPNERQIDFSARVLASPQFHNALNSHNAKEAVFAVQSSSFGALPLVAEYAASIVSSGSNPYHVILVVSMLGELLQAHIARFGHCPKAQREDKSHPKHRMFKKLLHLVEQMVTALNSSLQNMTAEASPSSTPSAPAANGTSSGTPTSSQSLSNLSLGLKTYCLDQIVQLMIGLALLQSKIYDVEHACSEELVQEALVAKFAWPTHASKVATSHFLQSVIFHHNISCVSALSSAALEADNPTGGFSFARLASLSASSSSGDSLHGKDKRKSILNIPPLLAVKMLSKKNIGGSGTKLLSSSPSANSSAPAPQGPTATPPKVKTKYSSKHPFQAYPLSQSALEFLARPLAVGFQSLSDHVLIAWECLAQIGLLNELELPLLSSHMGYSRGADRIQPGRSLSSVASGTSGDANHSNTMYTPRGTHTKSSYSTDSNASVVPMTAAMVRLLDLDSVRFSLLKWVLHYHVHDFSSIYDAVINSMMNSTTYRRNYLVALGSQFLTKSFAETVSKLPISEPIQAGDTLSRNSLPITSPISTAHQLLMPKLPSRIFALPLFQQLLLPCVLLADSDRHVRRFARDVLRAVIVNQNLPLPTSLETETGETSSPSSLSDLESLALQTAGQVAQLFTSEAPQLVCALLEKIKSATTIEQLWLGQLVIAFGIYVAPLTDKILSALYEATQNIDSRLDVHMGRIWGSLVHTVRPTWREDLKMVLQFLILAPSGRSTIGTTLLSIYELSNEHAVRVLSVIIGLFEVKSLKLPTYLDPAHTQSSNSGENTSSSQSTSHPAHLHSNQRVHDHD